MVGTNKGDTMKKVLGGFMFLLGTGLFLGWMAYLCIQTGEDWWILPTAILGITLIASLVVFGTRLLFEE